MSSLDITNESAQYKQYLLLKQFVVTSVTMVTISVRFRSPEERRIQVSLTCCQGNQLGCPDDSDGGIPAAE